jgi:hypothetical protein
MQTSTRALKSGTHTLHQAATDLPDLPLSEALGLRAIGMLPRGFRAGAAGTALEVAAKLGITWQSLLGGATAEMLNLCEAHLSSACDSQLRLLGDQPVEVDALSAPALS